MFKLCQKHTYFQKRHQARSQDGVERQPSHSQIFRNLNFFRKTEPCLVIRYLKRTNTTFFLETVNQSDLELIWGTCSAGLTIAANVTIAAGPALLGAPRSSVINLIYYIIDKYLFSHEVSILLNLPCVVSEGFQLNAVCVQKFLFDCFCTVT